MKKSSRRPLGRRNPEVRIGTSGWSYAHWRGTFYPEILSSRRWLSYYVRYFTTVEINNSFYNLPAEATLVKWRQQGPPGFVFAVKASRFITHMKKLRDVEEPLAVFLERKSVFKKTLGPVLFQLPPNLGYDPARLRDFLDLLPKRRRYAVEFRNSTWLEREVVEILADRNIAFCIHDLLDATCPSLVTASFSYFRFHGHNEKYGGSYPKKVLTEYGVTMAQILDRGKDVYAYFNNDAYGYAIKDAMTLRRIMASIQGSGV
jgi:uncharacterized protein YecE (DUF72 family)